MDVRVTDLGRGQGMAPQQCRVVALLDSDDVNDANVRIGREQVSGDLGESLGDLPAQVGLAGGYLLAFTPVLGEPKGAMGFWMGAVIGMALAAVIGVFYFRYVANAALRGADVTA